jgi:beta-lactamase class D
MPIFRPARSSTQPRGGRSSPLLSSRQRSPTRHCSGLASLTAEFDVMHKQMSKFFIAFLAFLLSVPAVAEDQVLAKLFAQQGIDGTIIISSLHSGKTFTYNNPRASQKFSTASTFKILNALISLEEKAISGKDDVLKWDGHIYNFPDWNRDQTLESAFKVSCVWCFQELARRVGAEKYRSYLRKSVYGELREPFEETTFWLDGSLQISAIEQVSFLKKATVSGCDSSRSRQACP